MLNSSAWRHTGRSRNGKRRPSSSSRSFWKTQASKTNSEQFRIPEAWGEHGKVLGGQFDGNRRLYVAFGRILPVSQGSCHQSSAAPVSDQCCVGRCNNVSRRL